MHKAILPKYKSIKPHIVKKNIYFTVLLSHIILFDIFIVLFMKRKNLHSSIMHYH